ncbi:MAG: hypothetical protein KGH98_00880 [Candidatus Micrarchaeota archaeon]|nr:hypothetical protein [Candidatus Micrarchaeota archaeon]
MANVVMHAVNTYLGNIKLLLLFSLSFVIALLIPLFAAFPTYNDVGGTFVRLASLGSLSLADTAVIVAATLFSLLFFSFAMVMINVVVKHTRTSTKIKSDVIRSLEKYTGKVFLALLLYTIIIVLAAMASYAVVPSLTGVVTSIIALIAFPFFLYAPSSIVIDEKRLVHAMQASANFFAKRLDYTLLWIVVVILLVSVFDLLFIAFGGTAASRYALLVFNGLFILPFIVVLQSQMYMKKFPLLKR